MELSLQEKYSPRSACYGCGPSNPKGLRIRSFPVIQGPVTQAQVGEGPAGSEVEFEVTATWTGETHQEAFAGMVCGGIIGTILDCHCNWTAAYRLMKSAGESQPPCTVTSEYTIKLLRPTPSGEPLTLRAHVVELKKDRAVVEGTLSAGGKVTATCRGTFVAVKPGHPAYHRW